MNVKKILSNIVFFLIATYVLSGFHVVHDVLGTPHLFYRGKECTEGGGAR